MREMLEKGKAAMPKRSTTVVKKALDDSAMASAKMKEAIKVSTRLISYDEQHQPPYGISSPIVA